VNSSDDWVKYKNDDYGNVYSYKKVNIDKDGGNYIVQVWDKQAFSNKGREKYIKGMMFSGKQFDKLSEEKTLMELDCKKRRMRTLSFRLYDTDGNVLKSFDYKESKWWDTNPDLPVEILFKEVCQ